MRMDEFAGGGEMDGADEATAASAGAAADGVGAAADAAADAADAVAADVAATAPAPRRRNVNQPRKRKPNKVVQERADEMSARLAQRYPGTSGYLEFQTPFQSVISVLLSAQTTDKAVNKVTPELFSRWPDAESMASASPDEILEVIRTVGLANSKSKRCVECARTLLADFGGEVPQNLEDLQKLPGVGRKTANVVLNDAFGIAEGVAVDTHVGRIARRMGFTRCEDPSKVEQDILLIFPKSEWPYINKRWIALGREICHARNPKCGECPLEDICPSAGRA